MSRKKKYINPEIGKRVHNAIAYSGLSRREIARRLDYGDSNIKRIEDGKGSPSTWFINELSSITGVRKQYLYCIDDCITEKDYDTFLMLKDIEKSSSSHRKAIEIAKYTSYRIEEYSIDENGKIVIMPPSPIAPNEYDTVETFKKKINQLMLAHAEKQFALMLDSGEIACQDSGYHLPNHIYLTHTCMGIPKTMYAEEEQCDTFEYGVIQKIAELDNVLCWHRNQERGKGFCLNGFSNNHYPDFIVILKSGHVILIETKGRHLDNSDSRSKIKLGRTWANKAGSKYRYFMVYEGENPPEGSWRLADVLTIIRRIE